MIEELTKRAIVSLNAVFTFKAVWVWGLSRMENCRIAMTNRAFITAMEPLQTTERPVALALDTSSAAIYDSALARIC